MKREKIIYGFYQIKLGQVLMAQTEKGLCAILVGEDKDFLLSDLKRRFKNAELEENPQALEQASIKLNAWLANPQSELSLDLDLQGTDFQKQVWQALLEIPQGQTVSYSELASNIDKPQATRAVATACGANHISIVVPCHRVVGKNGKLIGYHWGLERKQKLLELENAIS